MEPLKCPNHKDTLCMLKTGTKPGPQQGVSFYVCGQCKFNKSTHLEPVKCASHPEYFVELQSLHSHMSSGQLRRYYRCYGRKQGESWCGYQHFKSETSPADKQLNAEREVESRNNEAPSASESIILISDDEEDMERSVNVQKKASAASLMEVSFADLNKSQAASSSSSSHTDVKFAEQSFKNYRESPHPSMKPKSGISLSSKQAHVSDSDSSEESDLDESADARKLLKTLTLSDKDDKGTALTKTDGNNVDSVGDDKTSALAAGHDVRRNKNEIVKPEGTSVSQSANASKVEGKVATSDAARPKEIKGEEQRKDSAKPSVAGEKKQEVDLPTESLSSLMNRKQFFTTELKKLQTSLRSIQLQKLPDGGRRMLDKVKDLEQTIKDIDADISKVVTHQGGNGTAANGSQVIKVHRGPNGQTTFTVLKSGPNQNPPGFTSASQMMPRAPPPTGSDARSKTSNVMTAAVPVQQQQPQPQHVFIPGLAHLPQHLQQLFAANPQAMTLYGGRMTAQRLREVGSITTEAIDKLHKQLETCPTESTECPDPEGLKVTLMPHQRQALAWLAWREQQHPPGGILADDMGLGKTLTTISHILRHKAARCEGSQDEWLSRDKQVEKLDKAVKKTRATLIIAPASLVHQWAKEIERRCRPGLLKFLVYHGPNRERSIHRLIDNDIVLTTYTIISKEVGADKTQSAEGPARDAEEEVENEIKSDEKPKDLPMLLQIGWERIVLDEAHNIKNHKSLTAMSVCRLRAVYRWALTGTPIQNDLLDMYSLLRYLRFSPFDEFKVWKRHVDSGRGDTKRLNTIVKALLLRRTKEQTCSEGKPLVSLPTKSSQTIQVELSEGERTVYEKLFRKTQSTVLEYVKRHEEKASGPLQQSESTSDRVSHPSKTSGAVGGAAAVPGGAAVPGASGDGAMSAVPGRSTGSQILVLLLRLRQCCSHLNLMKSHLEAESLESDGIELTLEEQMKGMLLDDITGESSSASSLSSPKIYDKSTVSTKLKCVMDKLYAIQEEGDKKRKDKSVIVSQWTHMLEIVGHHLEKAGIPHSIIQGNIPAKKRMDIVDDFNSNSRGAQVLLLSLRAGGVGLNLVGGNHLFLLDIHWNPALEEQACDRIYRMGQKKDVFIYRFLCKDTIEEKIVALQQRKLSLAKSVLSGGGAKSQKLTLTDLRLLFGV